MVDGLTMRAQDRLFRRIGSGTAPLLVWGAHFFFCYAYAAAACMRDWPARGRVMLLATVLAVLLAVWLLWRALREAGRRRETGQGKEGASLLDWANIGSAVLGVTGILWTSVPLLLLSLC